MEPGNKAIITTPITASVSGILRYLTVSNLIEDWSGDSPVTVTEFFNKIDRAAKSGNWTATVKITVAVLKLTGSAALYLNSNEEATRDDRPTTYQRCREIFIERFKIKHLDQFHYSALQNATEYKHCLLYTSRCV